MTEAHLVEQDRGDDTGHLRLTQLSKRFGVGPTAVKAVDQIDLEIRPGEFVTILGPSGCGKTTTLRMIAGFERPDSGAIVLDGDDLSRIAPNRRPMAMVFQSYALFPHMTVFENVAYGLRLKRPRVKDLEAQVKMALTSVNIASLAERAPSQLSGGQQQRVALARALVMRPKVLLFDEPLSNLDAKLRVHMRGEIRRLQRRLGITSVFVTHDQDEAMTLSDRIVVMNDGRIEQYDSPLQIYRRPASLFVADFIGRANFLDAVVESVSVDEARILVLGTRVDVPASPSVVVGEPAVLVVRPEAIRLSSAPDVHSDNEDRAGVVLSAMFHGETIEYELETAVGNVVVVVPKPGEDDIYAIGAAVTMTLERARTWLLPQS